MITFAEQYCVSFSAKSFASRIKRKLVTVYYCLENKAAFTRDQCGSAPFGSDPLGTGSLNCVGFTRARYHPGTAQFQTGSLSQVNPFGAM